jgi:hypothetical protein
MGWLERCSPEQAVSLPGYLAVPIGLHDSCGQQIAVWSAATGEWTLLGFPWGREILGWVQEPAQPKEKP